MNNVFSLNRFIYFILLEIRLRFKNWLSLILVSAITIFIFGYFLTAEQDTYFSYSNGFGLVILILFCVFELFFIVQLFRGMKNEREAIGWNIVPVSTFEKCISRFLLYLIVSPLIFLIISIVSISFLNLVNFLFSRGGGIDIRDFISFLITEIDLDLLLIFNSSMSLYTIGIVHFRRHAFAKTIGVFFLLGFILTLIIQIILYFNFSTGSNIDEFYFNEVPSKIPSKIIFFYLVPIFSWYIIYLKIAECELR